MNRLSEKYLPRRYTRSVGFIGGLPASHRLPTHREIRDGPEECHIRDHSVLGLGYVRHQLFPNRLYSMAYSVRSTSVAVWRC